MKNKINLIGNSFTHLTGGNKGYSVHGKESKYIEWIFDFSANESIYLDYEIFNGLDNESNNVQYGWLLESKYIAPEINQAILENPYLFLNKYKYIFTHNKDLLRIDERFKWCPANGYWIKNAEIHPKSKLISFISSNKNLTEGHKKRLDWVQRINDKVDLFGRGFNEIENKEDGLCDYMFSVAIENGVYESYYTEKILDCFATGTIPVYLGSPDIGDYFNKDGIIELTEDFEISKISEEIYFNKLEAVKDNLERVKKIEVLEDFIYLEYLK